MTDDEISALADRAAERAVEKFMQKFGIYADEPEEVRKDMQHLRTWRQATNRVTDAGVRAFVMIILAGLLGLIWVGFNAGRGR